MEKMQEKLNLIGKEGQPGIHFDVSQGINTNLRGMQLISMGDCIWMEVYLVGKEEQPELWWEIATQSKTIVSPWQYHGSCPCEHYGKYCQLNFGLYINLGLILVQIIPDEIHLLHKSIIPTFTTDLIKTYCHNSWPIQSSVMNICVKCKYITYKLFGA